MKRDYEPAPAGDEILSDEEDAVIAAWTLDELDTAESAPWVGDAGGDGR